MRKSLGREHYRDRPLYPQALLPALLRCRDQRECSFRIEPPAVGVKGATTQVEHCPGLTRVSP